MQEKAVLWLEIITMLNMFFREGLWNIDFLKF